MRLAPAIVFLFIAMTFLPVVESLTTETQFSDGTNSYAHTFTTQGGTVGPSGILMPYGADVTNAEFTLTGTAANEDWVNSTTNSDFGGQGEGYASWTQGSYSGYRTNAQVENDQLSLQMQESTSQFGLGSSNHVISTTVTHNTTGGFVSNGDQGFLGVDDVGTIRSVTGGTWSSPGALVEQNGEVHVLNHVNGIYNIPAIYRWNSTTGQYIGAASINYNTCQSTFFDYVYDATSQSDGTVWTVSHYDQAILKWEINGGTWNCVQYWTYSNYNYPSGVAFDENGDMWVLIRDTSTTVSYYVWKVSQSSPNVAVTSNYLGSSTEFKGTPSGLDVTASRITVNTYYSSQLSYHQFFDIDGIWITTLGSIEVNGGHYGLEKTLEGHIAYTCFSYTTSYCTNYNRKILTLGLGVPFDSRAPSTPNGVVYGSITTLSRTINQITLTSGIGYVPSNSNIDYEISVDGGNTWKRANPGNSITFNIPGSQVTWRAWLNGTATETPILDIVSLTYKATFISSGYVRYYRSFWNNPQDFPVAATIWWNATQLSGSNMDVRIQHGGGNTYILSSGQTVSLQSSSYLYIYFYMYASSNRMYSPVIDDLNILLMTNAPSQVEFDIGGDGSNEWLNTGTFLGTEVVSNNAIISAINSYIPGTGTGTVVIPVNISSQNAGILSIDSFRITYSMPTINLDMNFDEDMVFHERLEPYEVITRHIIGESSTGLKSVELMIGSTNSGASPIFTWLNGDVWATPHDPEDWIDLDAGSYSINNNGILEIHWKFKVKTNFPEYNNVIFKVSCTDSNDYTPLDLISASSVSVNHTFGLGWLTIKDNQGAVQNSDLTNNAWVKAGETIYFQGQMWFIETTDPPKDSAFDVRVVQGSIVQSGAYDEYNQNGTFYIPVTVPTIDVADGLTYTVQTYHETNSEYVLPSDIHWQRTLRIDATTPLLTDNYPKEASYETASVTHEVGIEINDTVGQPLELTLNYWVEVDHDTNRNGEAELEEYVSTTMYNSTEEDDKWFFSNIDDSRNPNMAKVSYFITGNDPAGNTVLHDMGLDEDGNVILETKDFGFGSDTATWTTRQDSEAVFTGLNWIGHEDDTPVFSGLDQSISLGLIDANTAIDFEYIKIIFDFEGPNPAKDRQTIAYSGFNDTFWSESDYIQILPTSHTQQLLDGSQLPLIVPHFNFRFGWDWPDEQISDVSLHYKENGRGQSTIIEFSNLTFTVENDLVLNTESYSVEDISEPRVGPIYQGSSVRSDDRLSFEGRVTYQNSDIAPPRNVGIQIEVFDGENYWSDGSLGTGGEYNVEVSMLAATSLLSSETRTFLIGIGEIPGKGEDMTGTSVPTTLVLKVDHAPPRVASRNEPIDIIDISSNEALEQIPVNFTGWEENDLTGSEQYVNWVMRDGSKTIYAGSSQLGSILSGEKLHWLGDVDLTDDGVLGICSQAQIYSVCIREGYQIGFWLTGYDSAGNEFQTNSNSESDPVKEAADLSSDTELSWVFLGSTVAKIKVIDFRLDDSHVTPNEEVTLSALVVNEGAATGGSFIVDFQSINSNGEIKSFSQVSLTGIDVGEELTVITTWKAEEGVTKLRVVVDPDNQIAEVNKDDNSATHDVEVSGIAYTGWVDGIRENPLPSIGVIIFLIVIVVITRISRKTSIGLYDSIYDEVMFEDENSYEDSDEYDDEYDDEEYD